MALSRLAETNTVSREKTPYFCELVEKVEEGERKRRNGDGVVERRKKMKQKIKKSPKV